MPSFFFHCHTVHKHVHLLSMQLHDLHELDEAKEPNAPISLHQLKYPKHMPSISSPYDTMRVKKMHLKHFPLCPNGRNHGSKPHAPKPVNRMHSFNCIKPNANRQMPSISLMSQQIANGSKPSAIHTAHSAASTAIHTAV